MFLTPSPGGIFWEAILLILIMLDLFGSPPLLVNGTILNLGHVMQRLEIIENKVATVELIENLDKKIHNQISQYGSRVGVTLNFLKRKNL